MDCVLQAITTLPYARLLAPAGFGIFPVIPRGRAQDINHINVLIILGESPQAYLWLTWELSGLRGVHSTDSFRILL